MKPQGPEQEVPDNTPEPLPDETEAEEGFTLRFDWLILGAILLGLIWYFGMLKGFLYFLGFYIAMAIFLVIIDRMEGDT